MPSGGNAMTWMRERSEPFFFKRSGSSWQKLPSRTSTKNMFIVRYFLSAG